VVEVVDVEEFEEVCVDPDCARLNSLKLAEEYARINAPDGCRSRLPPVCGCGSGEAGSAEEGGPRD
jgi:hypothetical protein